MSDFIANIKAQLDLGTAESEIQSFINKYKNDPIKLKVDLDTTSVGGNNLNQQIQKQFQNAGKTASSSFANAFKNNNYKSDLLNFAEYQKQIKAIKNSFSDTIQSNVKDVTKKEANSYANAYYNEIKKVNTAIQKEQEKAYEASQKKIKSQQDAYYKQMFEQQFNDRHTKSPELTAMSEYYTQLQKEQEKAYKVSKSFSKLDGEIASNRTLTWLKNNSAAVKDYGDALEDLALKQRNATSADELKGYNKQVNALKTEAASLGKTGSSFFNELSRGFKQIGQFALTYGVLQQIPQVFTEMANTTVKVDDAMIQLQMATGVSDSQAKELMNTYSQMGKTLKATATDVAASSTEWLKQGKSIAESQKLAEDSIVLSKIGDLSSEDATKTITAAMKSYNLDESEVMNFIDQISAIDMASATDVGGLATAFNEVAANAKQAGVSTQELLSYAAAIGETTQEGMASVGTSLNAIFSRMGNIKLSRLKDYETGEDLSNVETVLRGVGIQLRDTQDEFRDFDEVLDETAGRWDSFSGVQQRAVAQAFAGTNHMNEFMVLMQQWENVEKYIAEADNASGQSLEKYEAYQDSLSGKIEGFKNQLQETSTVFANSDMMSGLITGGTDALNVVTQLIDQFGLLQTAISAIGGLLTTKYGLGKSIRSWNAPFIKIA